jgi:hypothetical protein
MPSEINGHRPPIRILHQLARSGGTIICRCLASMEGVVLLSEIHPLGRRMFDPLQQAAEWYRLFESEETAALVRANQSFPAVIKLIAQRCAERGKILVLRDWNHLDYTGLPFVQPAYQPMLAESLKGEFELIRFATVRHPLDQYLSLCKNPLFREKLATGKYLKGVRRFAEMVKSVGFLHYEDFTKDSDGVLKQLCAALQIPFDAAYRERWAKYRNITGDVMPGRSAPGEGESESAEIKPLPRQDISTQLLSDITGRADYARILQLLDYTD